MGVGGIQLVVTLVGVVVIAWAVGWAMIALGSRTGLVDRPDDDLKLHEGAVPPLGGLAVFAGVLAGSVALGQLDIGLGAAAILVVGVGLVDDVGTLSPRLRLVAELIAALLFVALSPAIDGYGFGSVALIVLIAVVAMNAVNLIDGIDGLAGSVSAITAVGLALLAVQQAGVPEIAAVTAAALFGFLLWNRHPARLFLGDNGAYLTGLLLVYGIARAAPGGAVPDVLLGVAMLGMLLIDLAVTVLRRLRAGRPLFAGDRSHTYDQLRLRGSSTPRVTTVFAVVQSILVLAVLGIAKLGGWPAVAVVGVLGVGTLVVAVLLGFLDPDPDPS